MKKKIMAVMLSCVLALGITLSPAGIETVKAEEEEKVENGFRYKDYYEDDILKGVEIVKYVGEETEVSIPKSLGEKEVISIGYEAFEECSNLSSIMMPESVIRIRSRAFYGCSDLESIVISESVTSIGGEAFYGCSGLESIVIPENVTDITADAFGGCSSLQEIKVAENNAVYASSEDGVLLDKAKTTLIAYPQGKREIDILQSVTSIGDWAFEGYSGLNTIVIPESVTSIGSYV